MSLVVEKRLTLPPDRLTLFGLYYQTVSDREFAKEEQAQNQLRADGFDVRDEDAGGS